MTQTPKSKKPWQGETGYIDHAMLTKYINDLESPIYYIAGLPEMVSAMKTLLTDSGVNEDNIRAEEFTGFNLNKIHGATNHKGNGKVLLFAIAMVIIAVVILHAGAAVSLYKAGLGASLNIPILYLMIVFFLVLAIFKLKHVLGFKLSQKKK
jgi:hypothetical protein